ncbi:MAG TPA: NAD(P)(+) transhydrogenase (Re/Si-specific) subunit beta [Candidatus Limnocylindrales bacterium]|nr:NAD(P)(+) transhydrogenase (Re/Si-specific) subunit beta [Candidatus Limnocylindrales bacterium]
MDTLGSIEVAVRVAWLAGAVAFVIGLIRMNSPATARNGNLLSAAGMALAIGATAVLILARQLLGEGFSATGWVIILLGVALGGGLGLWTARTVKMTAMPQLVSLFNAVGGGAAALIAIEDYLRLASLGEPVRLDHNVFIVLDIVIGSITFTGSLIASGKLQGLIPGKPIMIPGGQLVTLALALITLIAAVALFVTGTPNVALMLVILAAGLIFGVTMTLPIGGADMPVVISLLNSFTGTAVAMAGFVIDNPVLIIAGALVGAAGAILTKLMADAMNRSVINIMVGGFGGGEGVIGEAASGGTVRSIGVDDVAIQLAYAQSVIVVPGYGLAVAQAQHAVRELADLLEERGVDVKYAIHPVAGRMPGHMNVLLAEANVPYPQLKEMEDINPEFPRADVALVIGANDVTNPAARRPGSPVSGMPILDVDQAKSIVVIKRSMGRGYAGIDNELYSNEKTGMLFADAKQGLSDLVAAVKAL